MNSKILKSDIDKYLDQIQTEDNNIDEYYLTKLSSLELSTRRIHLIAINQLFKISNKKNPKDLTKNDIFKILKSDWWINELSNATRNGYIIRFRAYLKYSKKNNLVKLLPAKIKVKSKELNKNELISRKDLELLLKNSNLKLRTMIMVNYDGALRRDELLNIRYKDIKFEGKHTNLYINTSKTAKRNVPLMESKSYLKEYFNVKVFKPEDIIFYYKRPAAYNVYLNRLADKLSKEHPEIWNGKKLYPHLFRHSRLTELAKTKLNEAQLRKFAGWEADSNMAKIYFHIDDSDVIDILTEEEIKKEKLKKIKTIICQNCDAENSEYNIYCWKCDEILGEENKYVKMEYENKKLKEDIKEVKEHIKSMEKFMTAFYLSATGADSKLDSIIKAGKESGKSDDDIIKDLDSDPIIKKMTFDVDELEEVYKKVSEKYFKKSK